MSSASRALKRRRVEQDQGDGASASSLTKTPASSSAINGTPTKSKPSGQDVWVEAKAKMRAQKLERRSTKSAKQKEVDVYDDIDGANVGHEPYGRLDKQPRKKRSLDPLRNQRTEKEAVSPKKAGGGFFARFSQPKEKEGLQNGKRQKEVDTNGHDELEIEESEEEAEIPESEDEGKALAKSPAHNEKHGAGTWKRYVYGKPKKTFEDEIRELEASARKRAREKDSDDELASETTPARSMTRKLTPRTAATKAKEEVKPSPKPTTQTTKALDRRKTKTGLVQSAKDHENTLDDAIDHENALVDPMDLDTIEEAEPQRIDGKSKLQTLAPEPLATPKKKVGRPSKKASSWSGVTFEPDSLERIQRVLLEKATGKRAIRLTNLDDEYVKVHSIINQTVTAGESNSMLLIGARGSGKSAMVNQILNDQASKHPDDFHAVRLNGFIHTDDKIALCEIWRQLGRELDLDDDEAVSKNYADTMSKLLALLSHPAEMGTEEPEKVTKSVIFILDEFELFAGHPRQTLLYNLFDIAQSRKAPIAVLGLTTKIDVADSLEKRVKSRFSHRYVHLSLSKSFPAFEQICNSVLTITSADLETKERTAQLGNKADSNVPAAVSQWNNIVEQILQSEACSAFLRRLYYTTKSVPDFLVSLTLALATLPLDSSPTSTILDHFSTAFSTAALQPPDSKLSILPSLSTLQLALLICAARLTNIYNTEIISFALVYEEHKDLASKAKIQASASGALTQGSGTKVWSKDVARGAWEGLVECGLVVEDGRACRVDVGLEEIGASGVELGQWGRWCREI